MFEDKNDIFTVFMASPVHSSPSPPSYPRSESPLQKLPSRNFNLTNWVNHLDRRKS